MDDEEKDLTYLRFIVLDEQGIESGRHDTESSAIAHATDSAGYDTNTYYVAQIIGVAKPVAQPAAYTPLPKTAKVTKKRRTPRDPHRQEKRRT